MFLYTVTSAARTPDSVGESELELAQVALEAEVHPLRTLHQGIGVAGRQTGGDNRDLLAPGEVGVRVDRQ